MRRGKAALTVYREAVRNGVLEPTGTDTMSSITRQSNMLNYNVVPEIGDVVQWRHGTGRNARYLSGTVRGLLEPGQLSEEMRVAFGSTKRRWHNSKNYGSRRRMVVEVEGNEDKPSQFYVVSLRSDDWTRVTILKKAGGANENA